MRNSAKRVEFAPILQSENIPNFDAIQNHRSSTKLTFDNQIESKIEQNDYTSLSPKTKLQHQEEDSYCRTIECLKNEIISEDFKDKSGLKIGTSQTKSERTNKSDDSIKDELNELKQKQNELKSD